MLEQHFESKLEANLSEETSIKKVYKRTYTPLKYDITDSVNLGFRG